jgi:hypothetical protein
MTLADALSRLNLEAGELAALRSILQSAAAGLKDGHAEPEQARAARLVSSCLSQLSPHGERVLEQPYVWRGRLPLLDRELLVSLQREAADHLGHSQLSTRHLLVEGAPSAHGFANSERLLDLVEQHARVQLVRDGQQRCFYHYYREPSHRVEPHVDVADFSLSLLIMLEHSHRGESSSRLYLYPPGADAIALDLAPGEGVLFFSGSVIHSRSAPGEGETVTTLSMGFRPRPGTEVTS